MLKSDIACQHARSLTQRGGATFHGNSGEFYIVYILLLKYSDIFAQLSGHFSFLYMLNVQAGKRDTLHKSAASSVKGHF